MHRRGEQFVGGWRPLYVSGWRARLARVSVVALGLAPVALFAAPSARAGSDLEVLATLAGLALATSGLEVRLKEHAVSFFDPALVLGVVALIVGGPAAAFVVWSIPALVSVAVVRRVPPVSPGVAATLGGYALACLAGEAILAAGAGASPIVLSAPAGLAMYSVSYAASNVVYAPPYQGYSVRSLLRSELARTIPALLAMLPLAALSVALVEPLGPFGLLPLAVAVVLPQIAFDAARSSGSVARLGRNEAAALYSRAIADALGLTRLQRRALALAAELPDHRTPMRSSTLSTQLAAWVEALGRSLRGDEPVELSHARVIALRANERYDGRDFPAGAALIAEAPLEARILTTARAWAELTTGAAQLSHGSALEALRDRAGTDLDPLAVAAAERVVAQEEAFARDAAFEPRLHSLPLPRPVRRGLVPAFLAAAIR